jgi:hypothetical protein
LTSVPVAAAATSQTSTEAALGMLPAYGVTNKLDPLQATAVLRWVIYQQAKTDLICF